MNSKTLLAASTVAAVVIGASVLWIRSTSAPSTPPAGEGYGRGVPIPEPRGERKNLAYVPTDLPEVKVDTLPPRRFDVIDVHEHVYDLERAEMLLEAMDRFGIQRACLMGTPHYTFTLDKQYGFERIEENNEAILAVEKAYPDRFCTFPTLDPSAEGNLERLEDYVARGADGLKLYLGHGASHGHGPFHVMPLDDPRMEPIYAYAEANQLPIVFHINLIKYFDEFVRVLEAHPYLRVDVPHFGLHKNTGQRLARFEWLIERYPNIYTDISFGWYEFHVEGMEAFAKWRTRSKLFFSLHADRILYGSDLVIEPQRTQAYIDATLRSYMQFLELSHHRLFLEPEFPMHGLNLDDAVLKTIYEDAPARFLLLDDDGNLPDRGEGWPPAGLDGLPPTVPTVQPLEPGEKPWLEVPEFEWKGRELP